MATVVDVIDNRQFVREPAITCPLCNVDHPARLVDVRFGMFVSVAECQSCRLAYQTPRPSTAATAAYMDGRWRSADAYVTDNQRKREEASKQLRLLRQAMPDVRSVLDFGAGSGMFVRACLDAGLDATGVELSAGAIARAKELLNVDLLAEVPERKYDAVTLWDVVEHLRDPVKTIAEARRLLRPGGVMILETGNWESWQRTFHGDKWGLYLLDHQFYFTSTSLEAVVRRAGFSAFDLLDAGHRPPSKRPWAFERNPVRFIHAWRSYRAAMRRWPAHGDISVMIGLARN